MRRALAYIITAPLVLMGVLMAHQASYLAVAGHDQASTLLAQTGHGYLDHAPMGIVVGLVVVGIAVVVECLVAAFGSRADVDLPLWPFAVAGPAAFFVQEHLERFLADGAIPWTAGLEPTFILGVLLQAPAAVLTYGIAARVVRSARRVARSAVLAFTRFLRRPTRRTATPSHVRTDAAPRKASAFRLVAPGRAPPPPLVG